MEKSRSIILTGISSNLINTSFSNSSNSTIKSSLHVSFFFYWEIMWIITIKIVIVLDHERKYRRVSLTHWANWVAMQVRLGTITSPKILSHFFYGFSYLYVVYYSMQYGTLIKISAAKDGVGRGMASPNFFFLNRYIELC
jgi:hypothetical protein